MFWRCRGSLSVYLYPLADIIWKPFLRLYCCCCCCLMYCSAHVTRLLVPVPCRQVVGEADREENPSVRHAGGPGQSGGPDGSERRQEGLGGRQSLGEGLPRQCKSISSQIMTVRAVDSFLPVGKHAQPV